MDLVDSINMHQGVGINKMIYQDDKIYTTGLFNTTIGLSSSTSRYPWTGVFSVVDESHQNYVLAFTRRS